MSEALTPEGISLIARNVGISPELAEDLAERLREHDQNERAGGSV